MATLRIHRFVEGRKWMQDYKVEVTKGMTVLEALISIKEHQDPSLSFTCSCRSSICGACAVRVNGNAELSCEKLVSDLIARCSRRISCICQSQPATGGSHPPR